MGEPHICEIIESMTDGSLLSTSQFWEERAQAFADSDEEGWAAVCHRGAPLFVNNFVDWSQKRIFARLLSAAAPKPGSTAVDIGCGTGRWTRALSSEGLRAAGYDVSPTMVSRAREISPGIEFEVASATSLPAPDASADVAASITVIHHL